MVEINNPDRLEEGENDKQEKKEPSPLAAIKVLATKGKLKTHNYLISDESDSILPGLYGLEVDLDTTNFSSYTGGGLINQIKVEEHVSFVRQTLSIIVNQTE